MTIRFYLLPIMRVGNYRGPQYLKWRFGPDGIDCPWNMLDYGLIDRAVVAADTTDAQHTSLTGNTDVYAFPVNLDATMTQSEQNALGSFLEAYAVPGAWLTGSQTFRSVLRTISGMFLFMQRASALYGANPLDSGVTLSTQWRNVPTDLQTAISTTATEWGYTGSIANNTTVRNLLKQFADLWGEKPIYLGIAEL